VLILSGCTFSLYSFVNLPFTVVQVNIHYNGKFARCTLLKCYNAYCTLLGGQFHMHKFSIAPCQITIFTSPLLPCKLHKFRLFYGLPKNFGLTPKKSIGCPICFKSVFLPKLFFLGPFSFWVGGGLALVAYPPTS